MTTNSVNSNTGADAPNPSAPAAKSTDVTKDAFLQLLVAQIRNQDPLNPTDGAQFLTQLAQFSQLEQTMGIRTDLATLTSTVKAGQTTTTSTQTSTGSDNQNSTGANNV